MKMAAHPYADLPDHAFWRRAIAAIAPDEIDPVVAVPFSFGARAKVATAGSCFAQHIGRYLKAANCAYLVTESPHPLLTEEAARITNYGVFTARYGNIYSAKQLLQLFERAYGRFRPAEDIWIEPTGTVRDPFRPTIQPGGFNSEREYQLDRARHFSAVREAFETLEVLVFTLGLTEAWRSRADGAVYPVCPGVSGGVFAPERHEFVNFDVTEVTGDLRAFIEGLRAVNPGAKVILTVSPVPLAATAAQQHVLASTIYSKSVLRVAAETVARACDNVAYFPSYEIIVSGAAGDYFAVDRRTVTEKGVGHVMRIFARHYLKSETESPGLVGNIRRKIEATVGAAVDARSREAGLQAAFQVMCDEEALDAGLLALDMTRPETNTP